MEDQAFIKIRGTPGDPKNKDAAKRTGDPGRIVDGEARAAGWHGAVGRSHARLLVAMGAADYCDAEGTPLAARATTGGLGVGSGLVAGAPVEDNTPDGARA